MIPSFLAWRPGNLVLFALGFVVAAAVFGGANLVRAHGDDTAKVHSCVNKGGIVRIVAANETCRESETALDWNQTGSVSSTAIAEFYALMPADNAETVPPGGAVKFPQDGPNTDPTAITRASDDQFVLAAIGVYRVSFQVPVSEPGQLTLALDGVELAYTVVGRATGTSQIVGEALVQTTHVDSVLAVSNPVGSFSAQTITPFAGGVNPVAATLIIERVE